MYPEFLVQHKVCLLPFWGGGDVCDLCSVNIWVCLKHGRGRVECSRISSLASWLPWPGQSEDSTESFTTCAGCERSFNHAVPSSWVSKCVVRTGPEGSGHSTKGKWWDPPSGDLRTFVGTHGQQFLEPLRISWVLCHVSGLYLAVYSIKIELGF